MTKKAKNSTGFTLIEVLVSIAVIAILVTLASTIFISTIRSSKKAEVTNEARQNGSLLIDNFQRAVRNASAFQITDAIGNPATIGPRLVLTSSIDGNSEWECREPGGTANNYIMYNPQSTFDLPITNQDTVDGVSIKAGNCATAFSSISSGQAVTLSFDLVEGAAVSSASDDYQVDLHFETTVSPRNF